MERCEYRSLVSLGLVVVLRSGTCIFAQQPPLSYVQIILLIGFILVPLIKENELAAYLAQIA